MTSQFPIPPADATRLLLVRDIARGAAGAADLETLIAGYAAVVLAAEDDTGLAGGIARRVGAMLQPDARFGSGDPEAVLVEVRSLIDAHTGGCIAVVANEAAVRSLLCEALGVPLAAGWRFRIEAGAVSVVEVGSDGRWALVRLNERGDLLPA